MPEDVVAASAGSEVFTRERRVRFLDHLAFKGNVRAAAAAGRGQPRDRLSQAPPGPAVRGAVGRGAGPRARATPKASSPPARSTGSRWRSSIAANRRHVDQHDARLLLAHLARLDRRVESDAAAAARAGRFDELLAALRGARSAEGFAQAAAPEAPPTRASTGPHRGLMLAATRRRAPPRTTTPGRAATWRRGATSRPRAAAVAEAGAAAGEEWDAWRKERAGAGREIVAGEGEEEEREVFSSPACGEEGAPSGAEGEGSAAPAAADAADPSPNPLPQGRRATSAAPEGPPVEIKSAPTPSRVTRVNPPRPRPRLAAPCGNRSCAPSVGGSRGGAGLLPPPSRPAPPLPSGENDA